MPPKNEMTAERREKIETALLELDHSNDDHWNADGRPAMKAVEAAADGDTSITREEVEAVDPNFVRSKPVAGDASGKIAPGTPPPSEKPADPASGVGAPLAQPTPPEAPPTSAEKFIADEIAPRREAVPEILELVVASLGGVEISHPARGTIVALAAKARDLGVAEALQAAK